MKTLETGNHSVCFEDSSRANLTFLEEFKLLINDLRQVKSRSEAAKWLFKLDKSYDMLNFKNRPCLCKFLFGKLNEFNLNSVSLTIVTLCIPSVTALVIAFMHLDSCASKSTPISYMSIPVWLLITAGVDLVHKLLFAVYECFIKVPFLSRFKVKYYGLKVLRHQFLIYPTELC